MISKVTIINDSLLYKLATYKMYMMTPSDQISHDLSYFSGPRTSGAENSVLG